MWMVWGENKQNQKGLIVSNSKGKAGRGMQTTNTEYFHLTMNINSTFSEKASQQGND